MVECIMLYEHIVRDYPMYTKIARRIEELSQGEVQVRLLSFHFEWAKAALQARKGKVELVVTPWMRWSPHFDLMWPFYKANNNVRFLVLNQEQIGSPCSSKLLMPQTDFARKGVYHCAWTNHYARELEAAGVPWENIYITGNAKLEEAASSLRTKKDLADEFGLDVSKRWLLFAESRNTHVMRSEYFQMRQRQCGVSQEDIADNLEYFESSLESFFDQLWEIPTDFFDSNELIYRLHPGMALPREIPPAVKAITDLPISDWIANVDALVTAGSTSSFEAEIAGIPVVIHNSVPFNSRYTVNGISEYVSVDRIEKIDDRILQEAALLQKNAPIYPKYVGSPEDDAVEKTATAALDILWNRGPLPEKVPYWNRKYGMRFLLMDAATFVVARTGMLNQLKWPHTAYDNQRDLPPDWIRS